MRLEVGIYEFGHDLVDLVAFRVQAIVDVEEEGDGFRRRAIWRFGKSIDCIGRWRCACACGIVDHLGKCYKS